MFKRSLSVVVLLCFLLFSFSFLASASSFGSVVTIPAPVSLSDKKYFCIGQKNSDNEIVAVRLYMFLHSFPTDSVHISLGSASSSSVVNNFTSTSAGSDSAAINTIIYQCFLNSNDQWSDWSVLGLYSLDPFVQRTFGYGLNGNSYVVISYNDIIIDENYPSRYFYSNFGFSDPQTNTILDILSSGFILESIAIGQIKNELQQLISDFNLQSDEIQAMLQTFYNSTVVTINGSSYNMGNLLKLLHEDNLSISGKITILNDNVVKCYNELVAIKNLLGSSSQLSNDAVVDNTLQNSLGNAVSQHNSVESGLNSSITNGLSGLNTRLSSALTEFNKLGGLYAWINTNLDSFGLSNAKIYTLYMILLTFGIVAILLGRGH